MDLFLSIFHPSYISPPFLFFPLRLLDLLKVCELLWGFPTFSVFGILQLAFPNALTLLLLPEPVLPSQLPGNDPILQATTCERAGVLLGCFEMMKLICPPRRLTQQRSLQTLHISRSWEREIRAGISLEDPAFQYYTVVLRYFGEAIRKIENLP